MFAPSSSGNSIKLHQESAEPQLPPCPKSVAEDLSDFQSAVGNHGLRLAELSLLTIVRERLPDITALYTVQGRQFSNLRPK